MLAISLWLKLVLCFLLDFFLIMNILIKLDLHNNPLSILHQSVLNFEIGVHYILCLIDSKGNLVGPIIPFIVPNYTDIYQLVPTLYDIIINRISRYNCDLNYNYKNLYGENISIKAIFILAIPIKD